jgi:hypothetical protein
MLLCLRNIGDTCTISDQEIATFMRITLDEARKTKVVFRQKGFIDGDGWNVTNWEKRQSGGCESLERVRRFRARKANVTLHSNDECNVTRARDVHTSLLTNVTEGDPLPPQNGLGPEYVRIGELAMQLGGDVSFGLWVSHQGTLGYSAEWIEIALRNCPQDKFNLNYLSGTLRGYQKVGGPPEQSRGGPPLEKAAPRSHVRYNPTEEIRRNEAAREKREAAEKDQRARERAGKPTAGLVGESDA